jgi:hypothetical protein
MITINYEITQLVCQQKIQAKPDAISGVHVTFIGTDGVNTRSLVAFVPITVTGGDFVPLDELTETDIRAWIDAKTDLIAAQQSNLEILLAEAAEPSIINRAPHWIVPTTTQAPGYADQRRSAYPILGDQLDMLWHAMDVGVLPKVQDFYDAIKAVKDQYPKT